MIPVTKTNRRQQVLTLGDIDQVSVERASACELLSLSSKSDNVNRRWCN